VFECLSQYIIILFKIFDDGDLGIVCSIRDLIEYVSSSVQSFNQY